jgi:triosephosphate isomerase
VPEGATAANTAIAYEPVWAIGSGRVPSLDEIAEMHAHVGDALVRRLGPAAREMRLLYGGSVNPSNAKGILALSSVDGALVGAASLKAGDYLSIVASATQR